MKRLLVLALTAMVSSSLLAFEDEPDELNWERLGGTVTGFNHFLNYCRENKTFAKKLLAEPPVKDARLEKNLATVWVSGEAFDAAKIKQWEVREHEGEKCVIGPGAHNGSMVRIGVNIPKDGYYRIWAKYWHEPDCVSAFNFVLGDGRMADFTDGGLTFAQNQFEYRFDWAEFAHHNEVLPNRKAEPRGWIWESTPLTFIRKGRHALTLHGLTSDGNFQPRIVNAIVFTQEPVAIPAKPSGTGAVLVGERPPNDEERRFKDVWERRPIIPLGMARSSGAFKKSSKKSSADGDKPSDVLKACWRRWRRAFIEDLLADKVEGVEGRRMAGMVYFDEKSNLLGRPAHVEQEKKNIQEVFAKMSKDWGWRAKLEAEKFTIGKEGWYVEANGDASGGAVLGNGYWGGEADASADLEVPEAGEYNVWVRYIEIAGYLARYWFYVEDTAGNRLHEQALAADREWGRQHGGFNWIKIRVKAPSDRKFRFRIYKNESGETYRRIDQVIVSKNDDYVPRDAEIFFVPYDKDKELTVWNKADPWSGYFRTTGPTPEDNLNPVDVQLREGEAQTYLLLARNNTDHGLDITPEIIGDRDGLVEWRVPALVMDSAWNWNPQPLLRRERYTAPAGQTVGVWLTVRGKPGFGKRKITVDIGGEEFVMNVNRAEAYPAEVPVPYVYGWSCPYQRLSCWELYKELGVNCIGDMLVPKSDADKYGIKLTLHLNDAWMDEAHIKGLVKRFKDQGYDYKDWTWSFMDEPGSEESVNTWIACAEKMKQVAPKVKLWVNPGEANAGTPDRIVKIMKYVNNFCPYFNHWTFRGNNAEYNRYMGNQGDNKFDIFMYYTTPCFGEKAPNAPLELLGEYGGALGCGLDGWAFFALQYGFEYSNSMWDEANNYMADQAVSIYRGAAWQTISTRNAEAVREAVQRFRAAKAKQIEEARAAGKKSVGK